jgi:Ca2+-binding EF-hand superfamily protein
VARKNVDHLSPSKTIIQSQNNLKNSQLANSLKFAKDRIPKKYDKLIHRTTQIPRKSIEVLIAKMDSDNDGKINVEDIRQFSHKNFIHFPDDTYE